MMRSALPRNSSRPDPIKTTPQDGHARKYLRDETAVLHEAVEHKFAPGCMTRDGYVQYLMMNRPFAFIEPAPEAARIDRVLPDWDIRRRRFALASDMHKIENPHPGNASNYDLRRRRDIARLGLRSEGNRRGARVILKGIESTRDPDLIGATQFLRHGAGMNLWASYIAALSRIDNDPGAIDSASKAAHAAFCHFKAAK
jgi:heme oxygenase (biliverdin-IX-beta and delta-forming)